MVLGGGGLKRDGTLPMELQCPENTWICLTVTNTRPSHPSEPTRVLQVVPVAGDLHLDPRHCRVDPTSRLELETANCSSQEGASAQLEEGPSALVVNLHGGFYTLHLQKAQFKFICDPNSKSTTVTTPELAWTFNGTRAFT
ncbi:hypothetical protein BDV98DRAFT_206981 [Pterulicium gracile]|uniref:Uncharacterized protein n=1 Tax=Pterulicium gracile TaxID=1884261 RepID=A0A5C3QJL1_9AGAR|nr:hypothetical protein BDV98DRAFT_206981 [Pterula gracilis]